MADTLSETEAVYNAENFLVCAHAIGALLQDHKGADVIVMDLRNMNTWTDFFVVATASSNTHLDGLERHIKEYCRDQNIEILRRSRKPAGEDDAWRLLDMGPIVVHLMSASARSFYELERLYPPPQAQHHSSKSS